jgi:hypothetical protein
MPGISAVLDYSGRQKRCVRYQVQKGSSARPDAADLWASAHMRRVFSMRWRPASRQTTYRNESVTMRSCRRCVGDISAPKGKSGLGTHVERCILPKTKRGQSIPRRKAHLNDPWSCLHLRPEARNSESPYVPSFQGLILASDRDLAGHRSEYLCTRHRAPVADTYLGHTAPKPNSQPFGSQQCPPQRRRVKLSPPPAAAGPVAA